MNTPARNWILSRVANDGSVLYVAQAPGDGGKDWGYVPHARDARHLSTHWKRRFLADMRYVNANSPNARAVEDPNV